MREDQLSPDGHYGFEWGLKNRNSLTRCFKPKEDPVTPFSDKTNNKLLNKIKIALITEVGWKYLYKINMYVGK